MWLQLSAGYTVVHTLLFNNPNRHFPATWQFKSRSYYSTSLMGDPRTLPFGNTARTFWKECTVRDSKQKNDANKASTLNTTSKILGVLCCSIAWHNSKASLPTFALSAHHTQQVEPAAGDSLGEHRSIKTKWLMMQKLTNGLINMMYAALTYSCECVI